MIRRFFKWIASVFKSKQKNVVAGLGILLPSNYDEFILKNPDLIHHSYIESFGATGQHEINIKYSNPDLIHHTKQTICKLRLLKKSSEESFWLG